MTGHKAALKFIDALLEGGEGDDDAEAQRIKKALLAIRALCEDAHTLTVLLGVFTGWIRNFPELRRTLRERLDADVAEEALGGLGQWRRF